MRSDKELAAEVLQRVQAQRKSYQRKRLQVITAFLGSILLICGLSFLVHTWSGEWELAEQGILDQGVLLSHSSIAGYVLVGLLGFLLGSILMYVLLKRKENDDDHRA